MSITILFKRLAFLGLLIALVAGLAPPLAGVQAQTPGNTITLTLAVPDFRKNALSERVIADFEAANPGVKVKVVGSSSPFIPSPADGLDKYFTELDKYAASADVLFVDPRTVTPEATRAGYFLDLAPLVGTDKALNPDDFFPALWKSYQWDKGIWALPTAADVWGLNYDPEAFDRAGVPYPNDKWTLDDLVSAIRALTVKDASGKVTQPGIDLLSYDVAWYRSLLEEPFYDPAIVPNPPKFATPAVEKVLDTWLKLTQEGMLGSDFNKAPMSISPLTSVLFAGTDKKRVATLLPGGKAALDTQGFAVSGGTHYPEQAYALARYLTTRAEVSSFLTAVPARKSLVGAEPAAGSGPVIGGPALTPEMRTLVMRAVENGIPVSETRFAGYLGAAFLKAQQKKLDAKTALQTTEAEAIKAQQTAAEKKKTNVLAVATPVPPVALKPGESRLKFGMTSFISPFPNQSQWDALIKEFTASDPQVKQIDMEVGFNTVNAAADKYDCFYFPGNAVPNASLSKLLNLDPFMSADKSLDKSDFVGNVLAQVQRDNKTWAMPISLEPTALKYHAEQFKKAGVPAPTGGWTMDAFNDALKQLRPDPKGQAPFADELSLGSTLVMLMAANGGLPLDYRTDPPTVDFTSPASLQAIRQVLDLAKQGYVKYDEKLSGIGPRSLRIGADNRPWIYPQPLNSFGIRLVSEDGGSAPADPYRLTTFPKGKQFSVVAYNIGTGYISAKAQNPDACYRWLKAIANKPSLFSAMPARRSQINDPAQTTAQGPDATAFYNQIDKLLKEPTTIVVPSQFGVTTTSQTGFIVQNWLYAAFDKYVLENGDLEAGLKEAETMSKGFLECVAKIPPADPAQSGESGPRMFFDAKYGECAVKIDPSLKSVFSGQ